MKLSQFETVPLRAGRVVFLGDSITEQGCWDEWFPDLPTLNRGIGGDTVAGVRARLDSALHEPLAISLLVGTNDLAGMGESRSVDAIAGATRSLAESIRTLAPDARFLINSVTPRSKSFASKVEQLNAYLVQIADAVGATYVDLWPVLAGPDGALLDDLTLDHVHLNGVGYQRWVEVLGPHMACLV